MALFVYCPRKSQGALELVRALGATRLRKFDGMDFWDRKHRIPMTSGDIIVNWGAGLPTLDDVRVLNGTERVLNKYDAWVTLVQAGLPSVRIYKKNEVSVQSARQRGFLPRTFHHIGGNDLLNMNHEQADMWVLKESLTAEYRIHSFAGKSIRAGQKVVRDGFRPVTEQEWHPNAGLAHPWIRSFDGGWRINYDGFASTPAMRGLASRAVKALGLTFGAVDLGLRSDGDLIVLEVNTAPGIEGNSIPAYVKAITKWIENPKAQPQEEEAAPDAPFRPAARANRIPRPNPAG